MQQWPLGSHATTFGGNPIACSAALATIEIIEEERLLDNVKAVSAYAAKRLNELKEKYRCIGSIRSIGMMFGIQMIDPETGEPDGEAAMKVLDLALKEGVLFYFCGNQGEVIRMIPPLTITKEQIDEGLDKLDRALTVYSKEM